MTTAWTYRPRTVIETEITAAYSRYLHADEAGDALDAAAAYRRMDDLLSELLHTPVAGTAT